jgi:hypothetical protein
MKTSTLNPLTELLSQLASATDHRFLDNGSMPWKYPAPWAGLEYEINQGCDAPHSKHAGGPNGLDLP